MSNIIVVEAVNRAANISSEIKFAAGGQLGIRNQQLLRITELVRMKCKVPTFVKFYFEKRREESGLKNKKTSYKVNAYTLHLINTLAQKEQKKLRTRIFHNKKLPYVAVSDVLIRAKLLLTDLQLTLLPNQNK